MKRLSICFLILSVSLAYGEPAIPGTIITFYITDDNLNTERHTAMIVPTSGLVDFSINGVPVSGPDSMVETGVNTGVFQVQLTLPDSVNGRPLKDGDVVLMTYHQKADYSGNPTTITQSRVLTLSPPSPVASSSSNARIGRDFTLHLYAPNYNLDSYHPDDIPLSMIEVRMGGVKTTLADSAFSVNTGALRETGPNTDYFEATFKIPREVDGFTVELGSTLEFRFLDSANPSSIFVTVGSIGTITTPAAPVVTPRITVPNLEVYATSSDGAIVNYLNSTALNNMQDPVCYPTSGSFFRIGDTTVVCSAKDSEGNSVVKSFTITVKKTPVTFPNWMKRLVGYWCEGTIDDQQIKSSIQFLSSQEVIHVGTFGVKDSTTIKPNLCLWSGGKIPDDTVSPFFYQLLQ